MRSWTVRGIIGAFLGLCEPPPIGAVELSMRLENVLRSIQGAVSHDPAAFALMSEAVKGQETMTGYLRSMRLLGRIEP